MILPDISAEGAVLVQERIAEAVSDVMFCVGAERIALSISVGAATHEAGMNAQQLIDRADNAMYAMKRAESAASGVFSSRIKLDELVGRIHAA